MVKNVYLLRFLFFLKKRYNTIDKPIAIAMAFNTQKNMMIPSMIPLMIKMISSTNKKIPIIFIVII